MDVIDPANEPNLRGVFAPTTSETDAQALRVQSGSLPDDLVGTYLRNGPNPRFPPLGSYTYPLDGDGMVHGLRFDGETARYWNRFVRTPAIEAEERAGKALWPGVMTGEFPTAEQVGDELAGSERDLVDINVVQHGGRTLALAEGARPFALDGELNTVGPYDFNGDLPNGICAHPKMDPATGEMVVFRYGIMAEPWLTWAAIGPNGAVTQPETVIDLDGSHMIHDFVITPGYLVLFVCPLRFDLEAMFRGEPLLQWSPDAPTRVAAVNRSSGKVTWFETETFWVWHFINAHESTTASGGLEIVIDSPIWSNPGMGLATTPGTAKLIRTRLDLERGRLTSEQVSDLTLEFPRIDDRLTGMPNRWFHAAAKNPDDPSLHAGEWNRLIRFDSNTGTFAQRDGGRTRFGEAVFAPRAGSTAEDDGYVMTYAVDADSLESTFVILDAADISAEPVAVLELPQRVPAGLHGNWLPGIA